MKIERIGNAKIIMSNPDSLHNYFAWPSIARLQNGKIAVVASGFRLAHVCPFGKAVISYSEDNGETYTLPAPVIDTPLDDRDSGLCTFGESGVIVTSFNNTREAQRGWNWCKIDTDYKNAYLNLVSDSLEERYLGATYRISNDCGVTFGPVYVSPVTSPHGPIETKSGKILWVGRMFSCNDAVQSNDCVAVYEIKKDGTTEYVGRIDDIYVNGQKCLSCEPHMIELDDGRLLCHIRVQGSACRDPFTVFQSISDDGGKTWSKPSQLLGFNEGSPPHILKHSSGALICVYGQRFDEFGIAAMISFDNGETWDTNHKIYPIETSRDLGYPASIELDDGSILTVFYAQTEPNKPSVIFQQRWRFEK